MELEKPKQKKKKRTKSEVRTKSIDDSVLSNIDIDFPSTSTSEDYILQEQSIEPDEKVEVQNRGDESEILIEPDKDNEIIETTIIDETTITDETTINDRTAITDETTITDETAVTSVPSAPAIEIPQLFSNAIDSIPKLSFYPDLEKMHEVEKNTKITYMAEQILLKPFTKLQLQELYNNVELKLSHQFEKEFIDTELSETFRGYNHILYNLLIKYSKTRHALRVNLVEINTYKRECEENYNNLWKMVKDRTSCTKQCADGISVTSKQEYEYAVFQENVIENVDKSLKDLLNNICFNYLKNGFEVQILSTQINEIIGGVLDSCEEISSIKTSDPITINSEIKSSLIKPLAEIRLCISILFSFLRKPTPDKKFNTDIHNWIKQLVAVQLRIATWQDHLFLLHHILRCPAGINSWATPLIQLPKPKSDAITSPFSNLEFHHTVALISALLHPIQQRNKFLEKLNKDLNHSIDPVQEDIWILVDSDGEEGNTPTGECTGLKENDLVALFNQIPFQSIYRLITLLNLKSNDNSFDAENITGHHLLKSLAFASTFVEILGNGLMTYNTERYKQFAKRLGRLIKHTVFYVTDLNEIFRKNTSSKDVQLLSRIQIELDSFLLRSCNFLYNSQNLGIWQYLSGLPFSNLSIKSIWKLYYCLHNKHFDNVIENNTVDYKSKVLETDFDHRFSILIEELPSEDLYYLLQAFSAMALSRNESDWDFITTTVKNLIMIGFMNEFSKNTCYKTTKEILSNMATKFPGLISYILDIIKSEIQNIGSLLPYLLNSLPLELWHPTWEDLEILAGWLLNFSYETYESTASRIIFSHLNWNFDRNGDLFLPHDIHIRMACLISEVAAKHVPEVIGSGVSESVRQVSHLIKNQSGRVQFTIWCWNMVSVLRLHSMDQNREIVERTLKNPTEILRHIPELERTQAIYQGVADSRPISLYLSILVSAWGHSVPLICQQGFDQLKLLINDYRHATVIRCLQLITPLFLECPESLSGCNKFQGILTSILTADRTYIKMAKELITNDGPGPIMEHFCNMIHSQLMEYTRYGLTTPAYMINLWLICLTEKPNWDKDSQICIVLDLLIRFAYQFPDAWHLCKVHFSKFYKKMDDVKENKSTSLMSLFSGPAQSSILSVPNIETLWLSNLLLDLEFEIFETNTRLWPTLLRQLYFNNSKTSIDNLIKKSANLNGVAHFPANNLVLYKLANLIVYTPFHHPLFPIICQQFFTLYLAKTNLNDGEEIIYGVSDKFYDGNISLMKKLKKQLIDAEHYYKENSMKNDDEVLTPFYDKCSKLCRSFCLWLEETNLNQMNMKRLDLPPQYDVSKLAIIFSGNRLHWTEYISLKEIRNSQKLASDKWLKVSLRNQSSLHSVCSNIVTSVEDEPTLRIIKRLQSYDDPVPPPDVCRDKCLLIFNKLNLGQFKDDLRVLDKYARSFDNNVNEHRALDCTYKESVRYLYSTYQKQIVRYEACSKHNSNCAGSAGLVFNIKESKLNNNVNTKINDNRELHSKIVSRELGQPENPSYKMSLIIPNVRVQFSINKLLENYENSQIVQDVKSINELKAVGVNLFYDLINGFNEYIQICPTTENLYASSIRKLGIFIKDEHEREGINILNIALRRPELINLLSDIFIPSSTAPISFLAMYQFIIDSHIKRCDTHILFVLLSKFDINCWLLKFKPKLVNISELIKIIVQGLESWNQENAVLIQGLLRRHLIHIFDYEFPEHYGEILQIVLNGCSNAKLSSDTILDILNSMYGKAGAQPLVLTDNIAKITEEIRNFATKQKLLSYKEIVETSLILAKHFQNERLQHGLHGLYPKLNEYCDAIYLLLGSIGYTLIVSGVHEYPGILADELVNWLWPSLCEMFSPWLIPYHPQHMKNPPANWIQQMFTNNTILLPWSELHTESAKKLIKMFELCVKFLLDMLPASNLILGHMFCWYEIHFANKEVPKSVLTPIHGHIMTLPWDRFRPLPIHIDGINRILQQFIPESHYFIGHIFLRISWTPWLQQHLQTWDYATRYRMLSSLLMIFVKLSYEPHVREHMKIVTLLQEACNYPWQLLEYQGVEAVLDWFVMSTEPSVVLRMATEHEAIDGAVLDLLQIASAIKFNSYDQNTSLHQIEMSQFQAKRILYVRSIVRLLRTCGSKYQQLLSTKPGTQAFHNSVLTLLTVIENILIKLDSTKERTIEGNNLMMEIICSLQTLNPATSKLFVDAFLIWQSKNVNGILLLSSSLTAIGTCKTMNFSLYSLLEATLFNYFRNCGTTGDSNWNVVCGKLGAAVTTKDMQTLLQNNFLLSLHVLFINCVKSIKDDGNCITFIHELNGQLENYKIIENKEATLILIWGAIIATGCKIYKLSGSSKNILQNIGRYLETFSNQTESWSEGILGVIGLKKDSVSTRRRILAKILANFISAIIKSDENSMTELNAMMNNKKFVEYRESIRSAITHIETAEVDDKIQLIKNLGLILRLFYNEPFLATTESVWNFLI